ncbi:MAG TPA: ATP phosphoribosyltransferase [Acidimicrobiales bacterium]|jgi:ATP phosphoribosyltransferase|nr:ATP phosphoribosyltransferase [Acidimicrobiales bacterium]
MTRRLTMALPSKGRLREPSWALLEASGVSPQEPGERVLQAHCRNADIDLLFVRADDVPEYVQDGVVDCGITGLDLVHERQSSVEVLLRLGYGTCSLQAAVSSEDPATRVEDLQGRRIATSHPHIAAKALAERGVSAEIITVAGSVEISPRLGLADAIIDLVSTGSTLRTNGLRSLGVLFESEAVLVGRVNSKDSEARRTLTTVLGSVINARANRYLLCNVSKDRLDEVTAVLPTAGSPSVMDLATPGVVAVHALVPAADIWSLLPKLEAAGASSILTLPIERMVP